MATVNALGNKYIADVTAKTDDYTLVLGDVSKIVTMNSASLNTLIVPKNSAVAFPIGTQIIVNQLGAGGTIISPIDTDVTIQSAEDYVKFNKQYSTCCLVKRDTNSWVLYGDLITEWTQRTSGINADSLIYNISYGNGYFAASVATGTDNATLITTSDPTGTYDSWEKQRTNFTQGGANGTIRCSHLGDDDYWVIAGMESSIGITGWVKNIPTAVFDDSSTSSPNPRNQFYCINKGTTYWVGAGETNVMYRATDPETTWTIKDPGFGTSYIMTLFYGNGVWVAGGDSLVRTATNPTSTWTTRTVGFSAASTWAYCGIYVDPYYVIAGENGKLYTATDAESNSWTLNSNVNFGTSDIRGIDHDGTTYRICGADGKIARATDPTGTFTIEDSSFDTSTIYDITFGDGCWCAVGDAGKIATYTPPNHTLSSVASLRGTTGSYNSELSPDGNYLAIGGPSLNKEVIIASWNGSNTLTEVETAVVSNDCYRLSWSPSGNYLAVSNYTSSTNSIIIYSWNSTTDTLTSVETVNVTNGVHGIHWHPDGDYLAASGRNTTTGCMVYSWTVGTETLASVETVNTGAVGFGVQWSPDGDYLVTTDATTTRVYEWNGSDTLTSKDTYDTTSYALCPRWTSDSAHIVIGGYNSSNHQVYLFSWTSGTDTLALEDSKDLDDTVYTIAIYNDSKVAIGIECSSAAQQELMSIYDLNLTTDTLTYETGYAVNAVSMAGGLSYSSTGEYILGGMYGDDDGKIARALRRT